MATQLLEDPTGVNDLSPRYEIGGLYYYDSPAYGRVLLRYYQFLDAVTYAAGDVCAMASATGIGVSQDRATSSALGVVPAGVALNAVTQNYYGFVQVSGRGIVICRSDGSVAAGEYLVIDSSNDDEADTMANGEEEQVFAMSGAADGADSIAAGAWFFKGLI